jgi:hypothetical protein
MISETPPSLLPDRRDARRGAHLRCHRKTRLPPNRIASFARGRAARVLPCVQPGRLFLVLPHYAGGMTLGCLSNGPARPRQPSASRGSGVTIECEGSNRPSSQVSVGGSTAPPTCNTKFKRKLLSRRRELRPRLCGQVFVNCARWLPSRTATNLLHCISFILQCINAGLI